MLSAPTPTAALSHPPNCAPDLCHRQQGCLLPQNSNLHHTQNSPPQLAHPHPQRTQQILTGPQAEVSKGNANSAVQHRNGPQVKNELAPASLRILQKQAREGKAQKKQTFGGEACVQEYLKRGAGDGFATTRSIPQERSLTKLRSNYLEASLREEEEIFKRLEEKALMLKEKEKKGRQILKQIRKEGVKQPQSATASLSALPPIKPRHTHRRGESCDLPLPEEKLHFDLTPSLDRVSSEQEEDESLRNSGLCKSGSLLHNHSQHQSQLDSLKGQLDKQKETGQKAIEQFKEKMNELEIRLGKILLQLENKQSIIAKLQEQKNGLKDILKNQLQHLSFRYEKQLSIKNVQIGQLNSVISQQTMKLQEIGKRCQFLTQQHINGRSEIQSLQRAAKSKNQEQQQSKRKLEREFAQLSEERRKAEQSYLKQIQTLKQKIDSQGTDQKRFNDGLAQRQREISNKMIEQQLVADKQKEALQQSNRILKDQNNRLQQAVSRLTALSEEKEEARQTLQQYLANAEEHIRKVEEKYHCASRQLTEKNVAYDFLWIQLKEEEQKQRRVEDELRKQEAEPQRSLLQSSENDSPVKQEERGLNRILSSSTLKDIKDLHGIMQQAEGGHRRSPSEQEIRLQMPLSHQPNFNLLLGDSRYSAEGGEGAEAVLEEVQPTSGNILLKHELSEAFSEENDEIEEMISNHNSNASKMESSLGAFSEYSRAKSTQSALSHKQVEQEYQSKMKNSKLMAKLGKFKTKK